jgi:hypothetical protein
LHDDFTLWLSGDQFSLASVGFIKMFAELKLEI